jgi:hypothetical protein
MTSWHQHPAPWELFKKQLPQGALSRVIPAPGKMFFLFDFFTGSLRGGARKFVDIWQLISDHLDEAHLSHCPVYKRLQH